MRAWRLFNILLLAGLLFLGIAWITSIPPFAKEREEPGPWTPADAPPGDADGETVGKDADAPRPPPTPAAVTTRSVADAVKNASLWLIRSQRKDGSWGEMRVKGAYGPFHLDRPGFHQAGPTAVALYALLKSGMALRHPAVRKGFAYLEKYHRVPATSPETSMVLMAVAATPGKLAAADPEAGKLQAKYRTWAQQLVQLLLSKRTAKGWRYNYTDRLEPARIGGREDVISTHLAALALLSARSIGIDTDDEVWLDILQYTLNQQEPPSGESDGRQAERGFAYILGHEIADEGKATGGATACGVATVLMARFALTKGGTKPQALRERSPQLEARAASSLKAALAWLASRWSPFETPGKTPGSKVLHHHWLWALETAMDLDPLQPGRLGARTWYTEIAAHLIGRQHGDGYWHNPGMWEPAAVLDTSLAILVLERASRDLLRSR